jgi:hypothetical protein
MVVTGSSEISVTTWCHMPEDIHSHCCEILKPPKDAVFVTDI